MANMYDTANQLERELRDSEQFQALKTAFEQLKENTASYELFKEFQGLQQSLQQKMMAGEEMSQEDAETAQQMSEKIQNDPLITELMQKEQSFSMVADDLNRIILAPVRELYEI